MSERRKLDALATARREHASISPTRVRRDRAIAAARREGATWEEITTTVVCSLKLAQQAVARTNERKARKNA